ncbi:MAG TPA: cytochrome c1 [Steroidobacteraceae bacterium]|jgi:ubiquinol-cytochrome c reductase cytochrome c1 subunit|nr:cytochrome c1 [Steroidobacteraceae bacterium]
MRKFATCLLAMSLLPLAALAGESTAAGPAAGEEQKPAEWDSWHARNSLGDLSSLQRGARNFMNYCNGCHAIKYMRYQRMADDLKIPTSVLEKDLVAPGSQPLDYITTSLPPDDAVNWFGKMPPDLSLITRYKGVDYVYQFLKTFYADPASTTGTNNLALPGAAMPAVLSDLSGVNQAVFKQVKDGSKEFDHFEPLVTGSMTAAEYDQFVRDTVNFLDYVGEPTQLQRQFIGIWVVLFLVLLTWLSLLLKNEYWKDLH